MFKPKKKLRTTAKAARRLAASKKGFENVLLKKYGKEIITIFNGKSEQPEIEVIPSKSHGFNWATARGGIPRARLTVVQGPESSGKTTFCLHMAAVVQRFLHGHVALVDMENSRDDVYYKNCGIILDETFFYAAPDFSEQGYEIVEALVNSGKYDLIILDSIAAMVPLAELEAEMADQQMSLQARINGKYIRRMYTNIKGTKTALLFVNQVRAKIGGFQSSFGPQTMSPGGWALKHAATLIIELKPAEKIKAGANVIGFMSQVTIKKNKIGQPGRRVKIPITYNYGVDDRLDFVNMLLAARIVRKGKGGVKGYFLGKRRLGGSWMDVHKKLKASPNLKKLLVTRLKTYLAREATNLAGKLEDEEEEG